VKNENRYRDTASESGSSWMNNTYEITFRIGSQTRKAILQACSKNEAREIFESNPQTKGTEIVEIKGVIGDIYFVWGKD
jgi:hypothetical protein